MKFTITATARNGKTAMWVAIPNPHDGGNTPHNIWDLPPELADNEGVKKAIAHAFELGALAQMNLIKRSFNVGFIDAQFR